MKEEKLVPIIHTKIPRLECVAFTAEVKQGKYVKFISRAKGNLRKFINHKT